MNVRQSKLVKTIELLAAYAAIPGGVILCFGEPSVTYKLVILLTYLVGSLAMMIYGYIINDRHRVSSGALWLSIELYGLLGQSLITI